MWSFAGLFPAILANIWTLDVHYTTIFLLDWSTESPKIQINKNSLIHVCKILKLKQYLVDNWLYFSIYDVICTHRLHQCSSMSRVSVLMLHLSVVQPKMSLFCSHKLTVSGPELTTRVTWLWRLLPTMGQHYRTIPRDKGSSKLRPPQ